jgi:hypothetical protein
VSGNSLTPEFDWRPQGDSNPRYRRERAVSWAGLDDGDMMIIAVLSFEFLVHSLKFKITERPFHS